MAKTFGPDNDGNSVPATLSHTISGEKAIYVDGLAGFPFKSGDSGDTVDISADTRVYRMQLPSGLSVSPGTRLYITTASVTAHDIPDGAWATSSGAGKVLFGVVLSEKDASNYADVKQVSFSE